jgi:hypothetical protein
VEEKYNKNLGGRKLKNNISTIENAVLSSLAVENIFPSPSARKITRNFLEGKITSEKAIERIKKLHGVK